MDNRWKKDQQDPLLFVEDPFARDAAFREKNSFQLLDLSASLGLSDAFAQGDGGGTLAFVGNLVPYAHVTDVEAKGRKVLA